VGEVGVADRRTHSQAGFRVDPDLAGRAQTGAAGVRLSRRLSGCYVEQVGPILGSMRSAPQALTVSHVHLELSRGTFNLEEPK
jgi:hypothetical protein